MSADRLRRAPDFAGDLPDDIRRTVDQIVVDRCGNDPGTFMRTEAVPGHVAPAMAYRVTSEGLVPAAAKSEEAVAIDPGTPPPHVRVRGHWNRTETVAAGDANIFGGLGTLTLPAPALTIPEAPPTASALGFYGARLLRVGDAVRFETDRNLAITHTNFGPAYAANFLQVADKGGGAFVEHHDFPHLHMPLEPSAHGHFLLGRQDGDDYLLSAFPIPPNTALYTPPGALHADPFLVGRYLFVYGVTEAHSTVVFRTGEDGLVATRIGAG